MLNLLKNLRNFPWSKKSNLVVLISLLTLNQMIHLLPLTKNIFNNFTILSDLSLAQITTCTQMKKVSMNIKFQFLIPKKKIDFVPYT